MDIQGRFYELFQQVSKKPGGYGTLGVVTRALQSLSERYDSKYMQQLWFPDYYPAAPLPGNYMIPTVCFKLTDYFSVDPDPNGNFALIYNPEATRIVNPDTHLTDQSTTPFVLGIWNDNVEEAGWSNVEPNWVSTPERIGDYYDQYRLVGASISLEYTGTIQEHSGYIVAGFMPVYKKAYCNLNSLRKSQYVQEVHPMEGIRCIWFPKDFTDDTFKYPGNLASPGNIDTAIRVLATEATLSAAAQDTLIQAGLFGHIDAMNPFMTNQSQIIMMFGTGLPTTTGNKFRGKIVRNFEGIPKPEAVDYVGAHNHKTSPETLDAVAFIAERMPELSMLPLEVTSSVKALLDDKYSFLKDAIESMKQYGSTLVTNGGQYTRGQGSAGQFVKFLSKALQ